MKKKIFVLLLIIFSSCNQQVEYSKNKTIMLDVQGPFSYEETINVFRNADLNINSQYYIVSVKNNSNDTLKLSLCDSITYLPKTVLYYNCRDNWNRKQEMEGCYGSIQLNLYNKDEYSFLYGTHNIYETAEFVSFIFDYSKNNNYFQDTLYFSFANRVISREIKKPKCIQK